MTWVDYIWAGFTLAFLITWVIVTLFPVEVKGEKNHVHLGNK